MIMMTLLKMMIMSFQIIMMIYFLKNHNDVLHFVGVISFWVLSHVSFLVFSTIFIFKSSNLVRKIFSYPLPTLPIFFYRFSFLECCYCSLLYTLVYIGIFSSSIAVAFFFKQRHRLTFTFHFFPAPFCYQIFFYSLNAFFSFVCMCVLEKRILFFLIFYVFVLCDLDYFVLLLLYFYFVNFVNLFLIPSFFSYFVFQKILFYLNFFPSVWLY